VNRNKYLNGIGSYSLLLFAACELAQCSFAALFPRLPTVFSFQRFNVHSWRFEGDKAIFQQYIPVFLSSPHMHLVVHND